MEQSIQAPEQASADTQEILNELAKEGHEIEGLTPAEPKPTPPVEKPVVKPEVKPDVKPEATQTKEPKDQKESDTKPNKPREPLYVPVKTHNDERHKRQDAEARATAAEARNKELEAKIGDVKTKPTVSELDTIRETATKMAEEAGYDPEFMTKFAETIVATARKGTMSTQEIEQKLAGLANAEQSFKQKEQELAQEKLKIEQAQGFETEFAGVIKEFPDLADAKEELKQLAFAAGNESTSLRRLAAEYLHDNPPGKNTAEAPFQGKRDSSDVIDYANITEEQLDSLDRKQLDEYYSWLEKNPRR